MYSFLKICPSGCFLRCFVYERCNLLSSVLTSSSGCHPVLRGDSVMFTRLYLKEDNDLDIRLCQSQGHCDLMSIPSLWLWYPGIPRVNLIAFGWKVYLSWLFWSLISLETVEMLTKVDHFNHILLSNWYSNKHIQQLDLLDFFFESTSFFI